MKFVVYRESYEIFFSVISMALLHKNLKVKVPLYATINSIAL